MDEYQIVKNDDGKFYVIVGDDPMPFAGPFDTRDHAEDWIDQAEIDDETCVEDDEEEPA